MTPKATRGEGEKGVVWLFKSIIGFRQRRINLGCLTKERKTQRRALSEQAPLKPEWILQDDEHLEPIQGQARSGRPKWRIPSPEPAESIRENRYTRFGHRDAVHVSLERLISDSIDNVLKIGRTPMESATNRASSTSPAGHSADRLKSGLI